ncbi:MAG: DUF5689 domain-containing protein [Saprospiraceae bacterium]
MNFLAKYNIRFFLFLGLLLTTVWACVDQNFDEPPLDGLTTLTANATVSEIKALHSLGQAASRIDQDLVIEVLVGADDQSGNLFRQIAVQDETGGFILRLNATGLYNTYGEGTVLLIKLQGLYIGDYNGTYQLNGSLEDPIEELLIKNHLFVKERGQTVVAEPVTLDELNNPTRFAQLLNKIVQITDVQFSSASAGVPYADAVNRLSVNRDLADCKGNVVIVRTSGFADFAAELTPEGKGSMIALLSVFGSTKQLILRRPSDLQMDATRCGASSGGETLISIGDVRAQFNGGATAAPANSKIRGVVISDAVNGNIDVRNLVIQDGDKGIVVRFSDAHNFALGEELEIAISENELSEFRGLLQVNGVANAAVTSKGPGTLPTPRTATVAEITQNLENWESTLVEIKAATLSGGATYNGNLTVSDATGSIALFTRSAASFSGAAVPTGKADIITIVSQFDDPQIAIRNLSDVSAEGNNGGGDAEPVSTAELRAMFNGSAMLIPAAKLLKGIVISDTNNGNLTGRNIVLQDAEGGIVVRFDANHAFALGEEVEINVSLQELSEFNGLLQVNNVPMANVTSKGMGTLPTPREVTIKEVIDNLESWESTLVKIKDVTFTSGGVYSGNQTLNDASGSILMFTRTQASFANVNVPTTKVSLTGIVSQFNDPQLIIRNLTDVVE